MSKILFQYFWRSFMSWFGFGLSKTEKENFENFQKNRRPSMSIVGRGTLTMSLEDAHAARKEKIRQEEKKEMEERLEKGCLEY